MNTRPSRQRGRRRTRGFSLVELLVVIAIIAILAGIVLRMSGHAQHKAAMAKAQADLARIQFALEEYRQEYGLYPPVDTHTEMLNALFFDPVSSPEDDRVFLQLDTKEVDAGTWSDPWGQPYQYLGANPAHNLESYDLWSDGAEGLNNW